MPVTFKQMDPNTVRLDVEIPNDDVEAAFERELKKQRGQVRLRGFRPGKAPLAMVKGYIGEQVLAEVTGELMQAVGRLRPLTNPATIYVVTNEPLPATLDVTAVYAAELLPSMSASGRRGYFQERVRQYAEAMVNLTAAGVEATNRAVCEKLAIKECNGFRYRKLAMAKAEPP